MLILPLVGLDVTTCVCMKNVGGVFCSRTAKFHKGIYISFLTFFFFSFLILKCHIICCVSANNYSPIVNEIIFFPWHFFFFLSFILEKMSIIFEIFLSHNIGHRKKNTTCGVKSFNNNIIYLYAATHLNVLENWLRCLSVCLPFICTNLCGAFFLFLFLLIVLINMEEKMEQK